MMLMRGGEGHVFSFLSTKFTLKHGENLSVLYEFHTIRTCVHGEFPSQPMFNYPPRRMYPNSIVIQLFICLISLKNRCHNVVVPIFIEYENVRSSSVKFFKSIFHLLQDDCKLTFDVIGLGTNNVVSQGSRMNPMTHCGVVHIYCRRSETGLRVHVWMEDGCKTHIPSSSISHYIPF